MVQRPVERSSGGARPLSSMPSVAWSSIRVRPVLAGALLLSRPRRRMPRRRHVSRSASPGFHRAPRRASRRGPGLQEGHQAQDHAAQPEGRDVDVHGPQGPDPFRAQGRESGSATPAVGEDQGQGQGRKLTKVKPRYGTIINADVKENEPRQGDVLRRRDRPEDADAAGEKLRQGRPATLIVKPTKAMLAGVFDDVNVGPALWVEPDPHAQAREPAALVPKLMIDSTSKPEGDGKVALGKASAFDVDTSSRACSCSIFAASLGRRLLLRHCVHGTSGST